MCSYLQNSSLDQCSGCGACVQICPKKCIRFEEKRDGFLYPIVDQSECIKCNRCISVCPYKEHPTKSAPITCYAARAKDREVQLNSSSGGVFSILAEIILDQKGIVVGAGLNEDFVCRHQIVTNRSELAKLRGSKYVQSECNHTFPSIKDDLQIGKTVLFTGTPCQVAGLKSFLDHDYDNLICIDLACHGVPSNADFQQCIKSLQKKGKLVDIKFRDKTKSGWNHALSYSIDTGKKIVCSTVAPYKVPYYYLFLKARNLRGSCYSCPYAGLHRIGDLTLADFWGAERVLAENEIDKGVSAVLINTEKGRKIFEQGNHFLDFRMIDITQVAKGNQPFCKPCERYDKREDLLSDILEYGYADSKKYINSRELLIASSKAAIPEKMKRGIRKYLRM